MKRQHSTQTLTIEEGYFHTGNSGITIRALETTRQYASDDDIAEKKIACSGKRYLNYKLEILHGAHGHTSTFSTPVLNTTMVDYYIEMLNRLKDRMMADPDYDAGDDRYTEPHRIVQIKHGLEVRPVWSPEVATSRHASESFLMGYTLHDCGRCVSFEPYEGKPVNRWAESSAGPFTDDQIGKPVPDREIRRIDPE